MKRCVIIQFKAELPERVLNALLSEGVDVRNVRFPARREMVLSMYAKDFPKLRKIRRQLPFSAHICGRRGGLFAALRLRTRPVLLLGGILSAALLLFLSTRILVITVEGCHKVPETALLRALRREGIYALAPKKGLELIPITDRIRAADERIAWLGLTIDGVVCAARVVEFIPMRERIDFSVPTDVVATKAGIIASIAPLNGYPCVSAGERVEAGTLLIRGDITAEGAEERLLVHARGTVEAYVSYRAEHAASPVKRALVNTGSAAPYQKITLAGLKLFETAPPFTAFSLETSACSEPLAALLPIRVTTGMYFEQAEAEVPRSRAEMLEAAAAESERCLYERIPKQARILEKTSVCEEIDGVIIGKAMAVTLEDIGMTKEILD